jgi:multiple sugar transport system permease protein
MSRFTSATRRQDTARRPLGLSRRMRDNLRAYLFVSPWIISLLVFTAYPVFASFYFSLTKYTVLNPPEWVGLDNFRTMFTKDPLYWKSVWNTLYYAILSVPLGLAVALGLAMLLNQRSWGIGIYRTAFYLPSLMPAVASTLLWIVLLDPQLGLVNAGLTLVRLPRLGWLQSAAWAMPGLILMSVWSGSGPPMLIFLAGLKDIPQSLIDAAMIDGANSWQRFRHVVLPLLTPTIFFNLIISIIASFQVFAVAFVASTGGSGSAGPLNALLVYMLLLYRSAFNYFEMGYASAMALTMFVVLVLITLLLVRSSTYWVYYQAGRRR